MSRETAAAGSGPTAAAGGGPPAAAHADTPPFESLGFTLSTLGFAVAAGFRARLQPLGLEPRDFALMRSVGGAGGQSQHAIAERLRIPASRMVAFIDALEARGLLERRLHPGDRRARALHLTTAGEKLLAEAFEVAAGYERELCEGLPERERGRLLAGLRRVAENLGLPPGVHAAHMAPDPHATARR
jgi:DNA-binding MarR family transcriptional regulator